MPKRSRLARVVGWSKLPWYQPKGGRSPFGIVQSRGGTLLMSKAEFSKVRDRAKAHGYD